jgi:hypothetical protein
MEALEKKFLKSALSNLQNSIRKPQFSKLDDYINHINALQKSIIDCVNLVNTLIDENGPQGGIKLE